MMRIVALALVVLTATAHADNKAAEKLFRAGEKAYKAQKFLIAAQDFEAAYKELPAPEIAFSAAQAYRRLYYVESAHTEYAERAVKYYQVYITDAKGGSRLGDAIDSKSELQRVLDRVGASGNVNLGKPEKKTGIVVSVVFADRRPQVASGSALHEVDETKPEGKDAEADKTEVIAKAFIDGQPVEIDAQIEEKPGDHVVRAEAPGYQPVEQPVHVVEEALRFPELVLQPLPAKVTVKTEHGATLVVDGRVADAKLDTLALAGGTHVITVLRTGRRPAAREVTVTRDQALTLDVPLERTVRRRAVPWVIGLSGVAALSTGVFIFGAKHYDTLANDRLSQLNEGDKPQIVLEEYNRFHNRRDLAVDLAIVSGSAAVAIGLTAAWLYYFDTPSAEGVKIVPYTNGPGGGAAVSGRF